MKSGIVCGSAYDNDRKKYIKKEREKKKERREISFAGGLPV